MDEQLTRYCEALLNEDVRVDAQTRRVLARIQAAVRQITQEHEAVVHELAAIHAHVEELSRILDDHEATAGQGIKAMEMFCIEHEARIDDPQCGDLDAGS